MTFNYRVEPVREFYRFQPCQACSSSAKRLCIGRAIETIVPKNEPRHSRKWSFFQRRDPIEKRSRYDVNRSHKRSRVFPFLEWISTNQVVDDSSEADVELNIACLISHLGQDSTEISWFGDRNTTSTNNDARGTQPTIPSRPSYDLTRSPTTNDFIGRFYKVRQESTHLFTCFNVAQFRSHWFDISRMM